MLLFFEGFLFFAFILYKYESGWLIKDTKYFKTTHVEYRAIFPDGISNSTKKDALNGIQVILL